MDGHFNSQSAPVSGNVSELQVVLQNAQSPDNAVRGQAESFLNQAIESQYGPFLLALTGEFSTEGRPELSRQLAGLYIKNLIDAKDQNIYTRKLEKWNNCDVNVKNQVKLGFLQALQSPVRVVNRTAAQVIGAFGAVDFPNKKWPQLLPALLINISSATNPVESKIASLEALGYMCDRMDPEEVESDDVNSILTAIVSSLGPTAPDGIKEAAISALLNSLDFTSKNFEVPSERDVIVQAICTSTQSQNVKIRQIAYECIAKIPDLYYDKIVGYVTTFFNLTTQAISTDVPEVASQAIEFWTTVALCEIDVVSDIENGMESTYLRIIEQAAKPLIPLLLQTLTKQPEDAEDDSSSYISDSGAICIDAIARILKDGVIESVLPFITMNIASKDWHLRDAAVTAFGSILEGPLNSTMLPILSQALPVLIGCVQDSSSVVKASAGWTLGRICEFHKTAISMESLPLLVTALNVALDDPEAAVASRACFAIHNLARACQDEADNPTNVLSHFMAPTLQKLFVVANRSDWNEENLRSSAYEASNMLICNCAKDMHQVVVQVLMEGLHRLEYALNPSIEAHERMNLQSHLCSLVGECIKKLETESLTPLADRIMKLLLQVFAVHSAIAHEDAFFAIGFFADKLGVNFGRYLTHVKEPLLIGLRNFEEYQVCIIALGTIGDICRALNEGVIVICDEVLTTILDILRSTSVDRSVKPHAISVFGDIATAIGEQFERYTSVVLSMLQQASTVMPSNVDDEAEVDYVNSLRVSIAEAYTGIIQTLLEANKQDTLIPVLENITNFIRVCVRDEDKSDELLKAVVGLIGDLGKAYGAKLIAFLTDPTIVSAVQESSAVEEISEISRWTQTVITGVVNSRK